MSPFTHYVVEFRSPPRPDVNRYVCVPATWIRWNDNTNSTVGVAYPEGLPAGIEFLVRTSQGDPNFWTAYDASVVYRANSYEQAENYLRVFKLITSSTVSITPISRRRCSEGPRRPQPTATTSSSGGVGGNNQAYKRPVLVNVSTRPPMHQTRPQQMMRSSAGAQSQVHDDRSNTSLQGSYPSTSMRDVSVTQNVSHGCQRPGASSGCCATKFEDVFFGNVQSNIQKLMTEFNHWATVNAQNNEKLNELSVWVRDYQVWKRSVESQLSERPSMNERPSMSERPSTSKKPRITQAEMLLIEDDDDDDVNQHNLPMSSQVTTRQNLRRTQNGRMAQFTLPPEYDPNNSRWTLRFRNPRPSLTELMPNSRIYVDSIKLAYSIVSASDCKSLARLLMLEVFSDNALKVCSFTGAKCPMYSHDSPIRPGLDQNARETLVKYVAKCGRQKGWRIPDVQAIIKTMRGKLEDCRQKAKNRN